jgi:tetratricopeptide (TPR) repeat protein
MPFFAGSQQIIYLVTALLERRHDCMLVCPPYSGVDNAARLAGIPLRNLFCAGSLYLPFAYRLRDYLLFAHETVKRARRALNLNPKDSRAWILGAGSLRTIGQKDEALVWAECSVSLAPESASTAYNYACVLAGFGEIERAIDQLENAVRPGNRNRLCHETDCDFDPLRDHPRFKRPLESI